MNPTKPDFPDLFPLSYDENITLLRYGTDPQEALKEDEFYVLMVLDDKDLYFPSSEPRAKSDFFKPEYYWIGLECMSDKKVYISKRYSTRHAYLRGYTMIASVKDPILCHTLKF